MNGKRVVAIVFAVVAAFLGVLVRAGRTNALDRVAGLKTSPV